MLKNSETRARSTTSSPTRGTYPPISDVKPLMKTKIPSDVVVSPSERARVSWRKNPYCVAPADVRARVNWVMTPRTS